MSSSLPLQVSAEGVAASVTAARGSSYGPSLLTMDGREAAPAHYLGESPPYLAAPAPVEPQPAAAPSAGCAQSFRAVGQAS